MLSSLRHSRLLYLFDSTSPVAAGERFRRIPTSARARMECDEWLGSTMAFEQEQEVLVYWWCKSHVGHLPEAAADALAKGFLGNDPTPVPHAPSRHVSMYFNAKASERALALAVANLDVVRCHFSRGAAIRATEGTTDALRHAPLSEHCRVCVLRLRDDHARLMVSRAYPDTGPTSVGAYLRAQGCPCGGGAHRIGAICYGTVGFRLWPSCDVPSCCLRASVSLPHWMNASRSQSFTRWPTCAARRFRAAAHRVMPV